MTETQKRAYLSVCIYTNKTHIHTDTQLERHPPTFLVRLVVPAVHVGRHQHAPVLQEGRHGVALRGGKVRLAVGPLSLDGWLVGFGELRDWWGWCFMTGTEGGRKQSPHHTKPTPPSPHKPKLSLQ